MDQGSRGILNIILHLGHLVIISDNFSPNTGDSAVYLKH